MKISVFSPVKNEVDFVGYSVMAVLPFVHEILYGVADSDDGTMELLKHLEKKADGKLKLFYGDAFNFDPMDMKAYNDAYNTLMGLSTGDALWFLHPDMIVTNPEAICEEVKDGPLAWYTHLTSYARDVNTEIVRGRATEWKNIHSKQFGLHYFGGYGSQNEDMYFRDITEDAYVHHGDKFELYPFEIGDSKIHVNHYCELKSYARRFEKMKRCLRTLYPNSTEAFIEECAAQHPRVTLEGSSPRFGRFEFAPSKQPVPDVFTKYKAEFSAFKKEPVCA